MTGAPEGSIGDLPDLLPDSLGRLTRSRSGGLRPAPQAELGQQPTDVVLDRLAADEEPLTDLGVREPVPEQIEDLGLAPGEGAHPFGPVLARPPRDAHQGRGRVGVAGGLEALEVVEGGGRFSDGELRSLVGEGLGQFQPGPGPLDGHVGPRERRQGPLEAELGVARRGCDTHLALRARAATARW